MYSVLAPHRRSVVPSRDSIGNSAQAPPQLLAFASPLLSEGVYLYCMKGTLAADGSKMAEQRKKRSTDHNVHTAR